MKRYLTVEELEKIVDLVKCPADLITIIDNWGLSMAFVEPLCRLWSKSYDESINFEKLKRIEQTSSPNNLEL